MRSRRGIVDPVTLAVVAGIAIGIFASNWKPLAFLRPKPPTEQLTAMQAKLDIATLEAEKARIAREAAVVAERAKLEAQVRAAQVDNTGTVAALKRVPAAQQSPEVKLAARMALRVDLKLAIAIGRLPEADQMAMVELIEQALSDKQADLDEANRKLAEADANFKVVSGERDVLKAQIPKLTAKVADSEAEAAMAQAEVNVKIKDVKTWAEKADAALRDGSGFADSVRKVAYFLIGGYILVVFIIPGLVKHLATDNPLKGLLRDVSGYIASPLLYRDAKAKIQEALMTEPPK
jgi:hypothetical protein